MKKKVKIIIISVLVAAIVIGGIGGAVYYKKSSGTAKVQSVSMISTTNDYTSMTSEGIVCDDASQTIYLQDGQKVAEVYVTKGQQVKAGDKLMAYDVTSLSLSVEMKKLEISSYENQLATEKEKLEKLKNTKPVAKKSEDSSTDTVPDTTPVPDTQPSHDDTKIDEIHDVISDLSQALGSGSADDPYVISCSMDSYVSGSLLNELISEGAIAKFIVGDEADPDMELTIKGDTLSGYEDSDEIRLFLGSTSLDTNSYTEISDDDMAATQQVVNGNNNTAQDSSENDENEERTYTADELKEAIQEQTRSVATTDLEKRMAQAELKELETQLEDGIVYAKKDGVVTTVGDPQNPPQDGSAFLQMSGAEGLYISGTVGELDLDTVKVGQSVTAVNYSTGASFEGTISNISNVPSDSTNYYGDNNPNSSFYEYTAYIENSEGLNKGDYLELTIDTSSENASGGLFIDKAYIRTEKGQSYVYKDDNGKLVKQIVSTGQSLWGSYTEVKSGLTEDDYIAFPYGVAEGEKTQISDDLY